MTDDVRTDLSAYFRAQAEWRKGKAEEYPDDERNAQSARALASLAEYVETNPDLGGELDALAPHLFEQFTLGGEETQRVVSRYGYGYGVRDSQHAELLDELVALCLVDAYEFAAEHGEDPTETLLDFEVEAARDGVHVPRRYFERRSRWTEPELEETIEAFRTNGGGE